VVDHFGRHFANIKAVTVGFLDVQRTVAFPGNAYAFMEAFDLERLAGQQKAFAVTRNHFIQGDGGGFPVNLDQVTLEALAALVKGDDQRIVAF